MMINIHGWDTPERHRQAVWFSTGYDKGDYFIFDEIDVLAIKHQKSGQHLRIATLPILLINFKEPEEKDRFRRCLAICLFASLTNSTLVEFTFRLLRDNMRSLNIWSKKNSNLLRSQISRETSIEVPVDLVGDGHACEAEWSGQNPNRCQDYTCSIERMPPLLGDMRNRSFYELTCEQMENCYWILRVNRTTHPTVKKARDRMRGEGWDDVLGKHRRMFRRGEGWDGAGSGPMEIEGVNC